MKRGGSRPRPPRVKRHSTVGVRTRHTTVPAQPPRGERRHDRRRPPAARKVAQIIEEESSLLDVLDNLLSNGVVLNADVVLALANVDLVYLRLSALLCAADRVVPS